MREKNNILSANKQSSKLHTAVSIAFSYLHQCRMKTGRKMLLFIVLSEDSRKEGGAKGKTLWGRPWSMRFDLCDLNAIKEMLHPFIVIFFQLFPEIG